MDNEKSHREEAMDPDIEKLAKEGLSQLLEAARLAGGRSSAQAKAFNNFFGRQVNHVFAATLEFSR